VARLTPEELQEALKIIKTFSETVAEPSQPWERLRISVELMGLRQARPHLLMSLIWETMVKAVDSEALADLRGLQHSPQPQKSLKLQTSPVVGPAPESLLPALSQTSPDPQTSAIPGPAH